MFLSFCRKLIHSFAFFDSDFEALWAKKWQPKIPWKKKEEKEIFELEMWGVARQWLLHINNCFHIDRNRYLNMSRVSPWLNRCHHRHGTAMWCDTKRYQNLHWNATKQQVHFTIWHIHKSNDSSLNDIEMSEYIFVSFYLPHLNFVWSLFYGDCERATERATERVSGLTGARSFTSQNLPLTRKIHFNYFAFYGESLFVAIAQIECDSV